MTYKEERFLQLSILEAGRLEVDELHLIRASRGWTFCVESKASHGVKTWKRYQSGLLTALLLEVTH